MTSDPRPAALGEPFAFEQEPDVWLVGQSALSPNLGQTESWWFPLWWDGPGARTWRYEGPGRLPESAVRFPTLEAAAGALEASP